MEVGWAASRHMPCCWRGLRKSTRPVGMPRTTSQLNPSSGSRSAKWSSGDSSNRTSRPSARVSSSATDSAILMAVSTRLRGSFSCCSSAAIWREFKRKQEQANCWISSTEDFGACKNWAHWLILAKWQSAANSNPCRSAHSSSNWSRSVITLPQSPVHIWEFATICESGNNEISGFGRESCKTVVPIDISRKQLFLYIWTIMFEIAISYKLVSYLVI